MRVSCFIANQMVIDLVCSDNNIGEAGARAIAQAQLACRALTMLNLGSMHFLVVIANQTV
jgi:hypothetical protein